MYSHHDEPPCNCVSVRRSLNSSKSPFLRTSRYSRRWGYVVSRSSCHGDFKMPTKIAIVEYNVTETIKRGIGPSKFNKLYSHYSWEVLGERPGNVTMCLELGDQREYQISGFAAVETVRRILSRFSKNWGAVISKIRTCIHKTGGGAAGKSDEPAVSSI